MSTNHTNGFCHRCGEFVAKGTGRFVRGWFYHRACYSNHHNSRRGK